MTHAEEAPDQTWVFDSPQPLAGTPEIAAPMLLPLSAVALRRGLWDSGDSEHADGPTTSRRE